METQDAQTLRVCSVLRTGGAGGRSSPAKDPASAGALCARFVTELGRGKRVTLRVYALARGALLRGITSLALPAHASVRDVLHPSI